MRVKLFSVVLCSLSGSLCDARRNVTKIGTTMSPTLVIPGKGKGAPKPLTRCPDTHPYAFDGGKHCCSIGLERNDTTLDESCDGNRVNIPTALDCCYAGQFVPCNGEERGYNHALESCSPNPTVIKENSVFQDNYALFGPSAVLKLITCEKRPDYWMANNGVTDAWFVVDLGCVVLIEKFYARNTRNAAYAYNRCTKDFTIEVSTDMSDWQLTVEGTMQDGREFAVCEMPVEEFHPSPVTLGRYVRFTARTYYGLGAGLNWLGFQILN